MLAIFHNASCSYNMNHIQRNFTTYWRGVRKVLVKSGKTLRTKSEQV